MFASMRAAPALCRDRGAARPGDRAHRLGRRAAGPGDKLAVRMSHDDKLIRQLSLVAFLMAERRPLTARDVKTNIEGFSGCPTRHSRAGSTRTDRNAVAPGVPLQSQRDEFTGEELYTLRSDQYFLPPLEISDEELAALLRTALYLLEGKFAYAEPLRLREPRARPARVPRPEPGRGRVSRATPTTRRRWPGGSASSRRRSRSAAQCGSSTGRSRATTSASARSTRWRS